MSLRMRLFPDSTRIRATMNNTPSAAGRGKQREHEHEHEHEHEGGHQRSCHIRASALDGEHAPTFAKIAATGNMITYTL